MYIETHENRLYAVKLNIRENAEKDGRAKYTSAEKMVQTEKNCKC